MWNLSTVLRAFWILAEAEAVEIYIIDLCSLKRLSPWFNTGQVSEKVINQAWLWRFMADYQIQNYELGGRSQGHGVSNVSTAAFSLWHAYDILWLFPFALPSKGCANICTAAPRSARTNCCEETRQGLEIHAGGFPTMMMTTMMMMTTTPMMMMMMMMMAKNIEEDTDDGDDDGFKSKIRSDLQTCGWIELCSASVSLQTQTRAVSHVFWSHTGQCNTMQPKEFSVRMGKSNMAKLHSSSPNS